MAIIKYWNSYGNLTCWSLPKPLYLLNNLFSDQCSRPTSESYWRLFPLESWTCCTILFVFWTVEKAAEQQRRSALESAESVPASYCSLYIERTQTHRCRRKILQLQPATLFPSAVNLYAISLCFNPTNDRMHNNVALLKKFLH